MAAAAAARAAAEAAQARTYEMLEEYSASYLDWAVHLLAWARPAREERLAELDEIEAAMTLSASERDERARLRRNCVIAECLCHIRGLAPSVDAAGRLG